MKKKLNGIWPAIVLGREEERLSNRDRGSQVAEDLYVKIKDLEKERGEITKHSLADYVTAKISQGEFQKRMAKVDKLGEELRPLTKARDQVIGESQEIAEKADAEMVAGIVAEIDKLTVEESAVLAELAKMVPPLYEKASVLWMLQECRSRLYEMARKITKSRTNLGLQKDAELEKVFKVSDFGARNFGGILKVIIWALTDPKGNGVCGVQIPDLLETAFPQPKSKPRTPGKKGPARVVTIVDTDGSTETHVMHPKS